MTELLKAENKTEEEMATLVKRSASTIFRWRREGIDYISWVGMLALLKRDLEWKPDEAKKKATKPRA